MTCAAQTIKNLSMGEFLKYAVPGDRLEFYRGHLARDRGPEKWDTKTAKQKEASQTADEAYKASEQGLVLLVQQRNQHGYYIYLAVRSSAP